MVIVYLLILLNVAVHYAKWSEITSIEKKPKTPSTKELRENISSRSAKLRYAIKKENFYNFETDIFEKFKHLIEIENFGKKL